MGAGASIIKDSAALVTDSASDIEDHAPDFPLPNQGSAPGCEGMSALSLAAAPESETLMEEQAPDSKLRSNFFTVFEQI